MKALCVRQPWAWLLFHGKNIENRKWWTGYRGPLVILASQAMTRAEYESALYFVHAFNSELAAQIPDRESLVYGHALGTVRQVGCVHDLGVNPHAESPWFQGPFGHVYEAATEFTVPLRGTRGRLRFCEWEPEAGADADNFAGHVTKYLSSSEASTVIDSGAQGVEGANSDPTHKEAS